MKVIAINGSARKKGNTSILIQTVFDELKAAGIETEEISLATDNIAPCRACQMAYLLHALQQVKQ